LAAKCGVDYPKMIYEYLHRGTIPTVINYELGTVWLNIYTDTVYSILRVLRRIDSPITILKSYKRFTEATWDIVDPLPFAICKICSSHDQVFKDKMIPYYNPHFGFNDLIQTIFCRDAEEKLADKFRAQTGKRHILFTSSCRSALYLAYKAIGQIGMVHTSPLTCKVALLPILASGNSICFHDIQASDWTIDPITIPSAVSDKSIAIQAIHFGGFPCDMPSLRRIADDHSLVLVEDCAQGYGASYDGVQTGQLGDISCFTLTKNLFSLGGGVLATNNREWYLRARQIQEQFRPEKNVKALYRLLLALLMTYRKFSLCEKLYQLFKGSTKSTESNDALGALNKELTLPPSIYIKSCCSRWDKIQNLVRLRMTEAESLMSFLDIQVERRQNNTKSVSSYTKLFLNSGGDSPEKISDLNAKGIEAMHLEHKHKVYYQERLLKYSDADCPCIKYNSYNEIHDTLISLPIEYFANMRNKDWSAVKFLLNGNI